MQMKNVVFAGVLVATGLIAGFAIGAAAPKKSEMVAAPELKWAEMAPGSPVQIATLWGDRAKGEYAMLLKMPAGAEAGVHAHTADYQAVCVQGTWKHSDEGGEWKELPPGSHVMQPGKAFHNDACKGPEDCIVFVHQHKKGDFIPKPAPKEEKK